jgi:anti-anti-sigma factor
MVPIGSSCFAASNRAPVPGAPPEPERSVVWLAGEHDISNDDALRRTLARAIALGRTALVLDLGEVRFVSARTLRTISQAREFARRQAGSLTVRSAPPFVRRTIGICGLNDLLGPDLEEKDHSAGKALGSWVAVPTAERRPRRPRPEFEAAPGRHLVSLGRPAVPGTRAEGAHGSEDIT